MKNVMLLHALVYICNKKSASIGLLPRPQALLIAFRKINYLLISSFKALPGLNLGVLEAAMVMVSPVLGFLPSHVLVSR